MEVREANSRNARFRALSAGFPKHVKFSDALLKKFNFGVATAS
jgi:hypothetical protein